MPASEWSKIGKVYDLDSQSPGILLALLPIQNQEGNKWSGHPVPAFIIKLLCLKMP